MILTEKLTQELTQWRERLVTESNIPPVARLEEYYATFRLRFGPEVLANLDGEALLIAMHNHGDHDSLVYWLEFKNDDEFPAIFGSIAGGSALKFGIYRRRETDLWMTGSAQRQQELTTAEAIEVARRHRDQLLRGVNLLYQLPAAGSDADYRHLQEQLDKLAPDVSQKAWGHKYFSLLFPDKLDDYHNADYQRYHLIKLLQTPPAGEGRYLVAGRFVAIAAELGWPLNHLTSVLNRRDGNPHGYWRISTTPGGDGSRWPVMRDTNCVAIGWPGLGDLSDIRESKEKIREALNTRYPGASPLVSRQTREIFNFLNAIIESDLVLPSEGNRMFGIGRVIGDYYYVAGSEVPHRLPVEWLSLEEWMLPPSGGLQPTVFQIKKYENQVEIERKIWGAVPIPVIPSASEPVGVTIKSRPVRLAGIPGRVQAILERKRQVILYGPPGTGKTYLAGLAARDLAALAHFDRVFSQLDVAEQAVITGQNGGDGRVRLVAFHPAYGYEDFMEGYRPHAQQGQLLFEPRDGTFKQLCPTAAANPAAHFYLIIDEINRGDIPRIFGELLTVLEKDKRGQAILLPLTGQPFRVPDNVYLIGTMNTADRSIALLDAALRRRFGFIELMPDARLLHDAVVDSIPLGSWLEALNAGIRIHLGRDARNRQIGHAYLFDQGHPLTSLSKLARAMQDDILPLLEEYCYEDYVTLARILGPALVDERHQRLRHELFEPNRKAELIQALKAIDPNLDTSPAAIAAEAQAVTDADKDGDESDEAPAP
jgi:5-methylcytosine-specific restriction protein B